MSWMRKIFYVLLGVLQLGVLFISVLLAFYTYTMYENVSQKVKLFSTSPESNVSERQTIENNSSRHNRIQGLQCNLS